MPGSHARFSPSAANRRIHCPPSLLLEEQFEEGESIYAAEGTAGHSLAEHLIRKHLKMRTKRPTSDYYTDELVEAGIQGIWNFAPTTLNLPDNILVKNENLAASLAALTTELRRRQ